MTYHESLFYTGVEMVFLSEQSKFDGESPIRGGNPLIFPQFADNVSLRRLIICSSMCTLW